MNNDLKDAIKDTLVFAGFAIVAVLGIGSGSYQLLTGASESALLGFAAAVAVLVHVFLLTLLASLTRDRWRAYHMQPYLRLMTGAKLDELAEAASKNQRWWEWVLRPNQYVHRAVMKESIRRVEINLRNLRVDGSIGITAAQISSDAVR